MRNVVNYYKMKSVYDHERRSAAGALRKRNYDGKRRDNTPEEHTGTLSVEDLDVHGNAGIRWRTRRQYVEEVEECPNADSRDQV